MAGAEYTGYSEWGEKGSFGYAFASLNRVSRARQKGKFEFSLVTHLSAALINSEISFPLPPPPPLFFLEFLHTIDSSIDSSTTIEEDYCLSGNCIFFPLDARVVVFIITRFIVSDHVFFLFSLSPSLSDDPNLFSRIEGWIAR